MAALKSGHRGYYFRTADRSTFDRMGATRPADPDNWSRRELWCPAFQIEQIASATGSGDSSIAGWLCGFFRGLSAEQCLKVANCAGFQNLHALDALSGIKTWDETWAMVRDGAMPIIDPKLGDVGWHYDNGSGLWLGPNDATV
jgi:hypothetical protein